VSEANLWRWLKNANGPDVFLWRVENGAAVGDPDVSGFIRGYGNIYFELKADDMPKRQSSKCPTKVRPSQIEWHTKMSERGSTSHFILLKLSKSLYLIPGRHVSRYNDWTIEDFEAFRVSVKTPQDLIALLK